MGEGVEVVAVVGAGEAVLELEAGVAAVVEGAAEGAVVEVVEVVLGGAGEAVVGGKAGRAVVVAVVAC